MLSRKDLSTLTLDELADRLAGPQVGSTAHGVIMAEVTYRQTAAQVAATKAQEQAAKAAIDTAEFTKRNARYMLWSVIVLALSSLATLAVALVK